MEQVFKELGERISGLRDACGFSQDEMAEALELDLAVYQEYEENGVKYVEYNFTYLDMVMDSYRELGLKPFIELGFMPEKMASGTQTIFYWKGNTTPPKKSGLYGSVAIYSLPEPPTFILYKSCSNIFFITL